MMRFLDLPGRLQVSINQALAILEQDLYAETVTRAGTRLVIGCSGPGDDTMIELISLEFNHEDETYKVVARGIKR